MKMNTNILLLFTVNDNCKNFLHFSLFSAIFVSANLCTLLSIRFNSLIIFVPFFFNAPRGQCWDECYYKTSE